MGAGTHATRAPVEPAGVAPVDYGHNRTGAVGRAPCGQHQPRNQHLNPFLGRIRSQALTPRTHRRGRRAPPPVRSTQIPAGPGRKRSVPDALASQRGWHLRPRPTPPRVLCTLPHQRHVADARRRAGPTALCGAPPLWRHAFRSPFPDAYPNVPLMSHGRAPLSPAPGPRTPCGRRGVRLWSHPWDGSLLVSFGARRNRMARHPKGEGP